MRWIALLFFTLNVSVSAQTLKDKLQGDWVCIKLTNENGEEGESQMKVGSSYLRFRFNGSKLYVAQAPFDTGMPYTVKWLETQFTLTNSDLTESLYQVKKLSEDELVLMTRGDKGIILNYHFVNQKKYTTDLDAINPFFDAGKILISFNYLKDYEYLTRKSYYVIDNSILNLIPSPQFDAREFVTLRDYLATNYLPAESITNGKISEELIVEFDVIEGGLTNIRIIKNIDPELDTQAVQLLEKTRKRWTPLVFNGKVIEASVRLRLLFLYNEQ